jgi:hypothetical protein
VSRGEEGGEKAGGRAGSKAREGRKVEEARERGTTGEQRPPPGEAAATSEKADAYLSHYTNNRSERRKKEYDPATCTVLEEAVELLELSAPRICTLLGTLEPRPRRPSAMLSPPES